MVRTADGGDWAGGREVIVFQCHASTASSAQLASREILVLSTGTGLAREQ